MSLFDQDCITYTQEGRILQLEYAAKAVESAEYFINNQGQSSVSNAKMELFLEPKGKSSQDYLSKIQEEEFTM
jgi:hypothetical protein